MLLSLLLQVSCVNVTPAVETPAAAQVALAPLAQLRQASWKPGQVSGVRVWPDGRVERIDEEGGAEVWRETGRLDAARLTRLQQALAAVPTLQDRYDANADDGLVQTWTFLVDGKRREIVVANMDVPALEAIYQAMNAP